jgi:hypothetical protein
LQFVVSLTKSASTKPLVNLCSIPIPPVQEPDQLLTHNLVRFAETKMNGELLDQLPVLLGTFAPHLCDCREVCDTDLICTPKAWLFAWGGLDLS